MRISNLPSTVLLRIGVPAAELIPLGGGPSAKEDDDNLSEVVNPSMLSVTSIPGWSLDLRGVVGLDGGGGVLADGVCLTGGNAGESNGVGTNLGLGIGGAIIPWEGSLLGLWRMRGMESSDNASNRLFKREARAGGAGAIVCGVGGVPSGPWGQRFSGLVMADNERPTMANDWQSVIVRAQTEE